MKAFFLAAATATTIMIGAGATAIADAPAKDKTDYLADVRLGEKVDRICFKNQIDDFREPAASTVIVERGVKDYLVQTEGTCRQLQDAQSISFENYQSSGCVKKHDFMAASYSRAGTDNSAPSSNCRISAIYEWNEDAAKARTASQD